MVVSRSVGSGRFCSRGDGVPFWRFLSRGAQEIKGEAAVRELSTGFGWAYGTARTSSGLGDGNRDLIALARITGNSDAILKQFSGKKRVVLSFKL